MKPANEGVIEISDEEMETGPKFSRVSRDPRLAKQPRQYDDVLDEEELLAEHSDEFTLELEDSDDGEWARPPPTPRWQPMEQEQEASEEEEEEEPDIIELSDDESLPSLPPTPQFRELTPEPPICDAGYKWGRDYQQHHTRQTFSDGIHEVRTWTAYFQTTVELSDDTTVAVIDGPPRPSLEPIVELPPESPKRAGDLQDDAVFKMINPTTRVPPPSTPSKRTPSPRAASRVKVKPNYLQSTPSNYNNVSEKFI